MKPSSRFLSLREKQEKREKANYLRKARKATPSMKRYLHFRSLALSRSEEREARFSLRERPLVIRFSLLAKREREAGEATPLITFTASVIPFTLGNFFHFWCRFSSFSLFSLSLRDTEGIASRSSLRESASLRVSRSGLRARASRSSLRESKKREGSKKITKSKGASEGGHLSWEMGRIGKEGLIF